MRDDVTKLFDENGMPFDNIILCSDGNPQFFVELQLDKDNTWKVETSGGSLFRTSSDESGKMEFVPANETGLMDYVKEVAKDICDGRVEGEPLILNEEIDGIMDNLSEKYGMDFECMKKTEYTAVPYESMDVLSKMMNDEVPTSTSNVDFASLIHSFADKDFQGSESEVTFESVKNEDRIVFSITRSDIDEDNGRSMCTVCYSKDSEDGKQNVLFSIDSDGNVEKGSFKEVTDFIRDNFKDAETDKMPYLQIEVISGPDDTDQKDVEKEFGGSEDYKSDFSIKDYIGDLPKGVAWNDITLVFNKEYKGSEKETDNTERPHIPSDISVYSSVMEKGFIPPELRGVDSESLNELRKDIPGFGFIAGVDTSREFNVGKGAVCVDVPFNTFKRYLELKDDNGEDIRLEKGSTRVYKEVGDVVEIKGFHYGKSEPRDIEFGTFNLITLEAKYENDPTVRRVSFFANDLGNIVGRLALYDSENALRLTNDERPLSFLDITKNFCVFEDDKIELSKEEFFAFKDCVDKNIMPAFIQEKAIALEEEYDKRQDYLEKTLLDYRDGAHSYYEMVSGLETFVELKLNELTHMETEIKDLIVPRFSSDNTIVNPDNLRSIHDTVNEFEKEIGKCEDVIRTADPKSEEYEVAQKRIEECKAEIKDIEENKIDRLYVEIAEKYKAYKESPIWDEVSTAKGIIDRIGRSYDSFERKYTVEKSFQRDYQEEWGIRGNTDKDSFKSRLNKMISLTNISVDKMPTDINVREKVTASLKECRDSGFLDNVYTYVSDKVDKYNEGKPDNEKIVIDRETCSLYTSFGTTISPSFSKYYESRNFVDRPYEFVYNTQRDEAYDNENSRYKDISNLSQPVLYEDKIHVDPKSLSTYFEDKIEGGDKPKLEILDAITKFITVSADRNIKNELDYSLENKLNGGRINRLGANEIHNGTELLGAVLNYVDDCIEKKTDIEPDVVHKIADEIESEQDSVDRVEDENIVPDTGFDETGEEERLMDEKGNYIGNVKAYGKIDRENKNVEISKEKLEKLYKEAEEEAKTDVKGRSVDEIFEAKKESLKEELKEIRNDILHYDRALSSLDDVPSKMRVRNTYYMAAKLEFDSAVRRYAAIGGAVGKDSFVIKAADNKEMFLAKLDVNHSNIIETVIFNKFFKIDFDRDSVYKETITDKDGNAVEREARSYNGYITRLSPIIGLGTVIGTIFEPIVRPILSGDEKAQRFQEGREGNVESNKDADTKDNKVDTQTQDPLEIKNPTKTNEDTKDRIVEVRLNNEEEYNDPVENQGMDQDDQMLVVTVVDKDSHDESDAAVAAEQSRLTLVEDKEGNPDNTTPEERGENVEANAEEEPPANEPPDQTVTPEEPTVKDETVTEVEDKGQGVEQEEAPKTEGGENTVSSREEAMNAISDGIAKVLDEKAELNHDVIENIVNEKVADGTITFQDVITAVTDAIEQTYKESGDIPIKQCADVFSEIANLIENEEGKVVPGDNYNELYKALEERGISHESVTAIEDELGKSESRPSMEINESGEIDGYRIEEEGKDSTDADEGIRGFLSSIFDTVADMLNQLADFMEHLADLIEVKVNDVETPEEPEDPIELKEDDLEIHEEDWTDAEGYDQGFPLDQNQSVYDGNDNLEQQNYWSGE